MATMAALIKRAKNYDVLQLIFHFWLRSLKLNKAENLDSIDSVSNQRYRTFHKEEITTDSLLFTLMRNLTNGN